MKVIAPAVLLFVFAISLNFKLPEKSFVPPGTVRVNETLFYDKNEVTNDEWRVYENWYKQKYGSTSIHYKNTLPDTLSWRILTDDEPYQYEYYRNSAFNNHPVVGVTWEQANAYCKWRTAIVRSEMAKELNKNMNRPESITYRLPTVTEWEEVASVGYSDKIQKRVDKKNWKVTQLRNVISDSITTRIGEGKPNATITAPSNTYFPNRYGIFNLFGNVAEMTTEKGVAKGGSWNDRNSTVTVDAVFPYDDNASWLGFRCVCEVRWE